MHKQIAFPRFNTHNRQRDGDKMDSRPWHKSETRTRFRELRRKALLTQKRLGDIIDVCRQSISEIENGHVMPNPNTWARFYELEQKHQQPEIVFPMHWS